MFSPIELNEDDKLTIGGVRVQGKYASSHDQYVLSGPAVEHFRHEIIYWKKRAIDAELRIADGLRALGKVNG